MSLRIRQEMKLNILCLSLKGEIEKHYSYKSLCVGADAVKQPKYLLVSCDALLDRPQHIGEPNSLYRLPTASFLFLFSVIHGLSSQPSTDNLPFEAHPVAYQLRDRLCVLSWIH